MLNIEHFLKEKMLLVDTFSGSVKIPCDHVNKIGYWS